MNQTGQDLVLHFRECCSKRNKLFIPDIPRQTQVSDALVGYYERNELMAAVDLFIKSNPGPFLIFDFAVQSRIYVEKVKFNKNSEDKFKDIVEKTKRRMESE